MVQMSFKRKRRSFGNAATAMFYDQDANELQPEDIRKLSMDDPNYKLKRKLTTTAVQAVGAESLTSSVFLVPAHPHLG